MSIGRFAGATGLSVTTLRHYDDVGLLPPTYVDPATGYRWYAPAQGARADLIRRLRSVDIPVGDVSEILDALGEPERIASLIAAHTERLETAAVQVADAQDLLTQLSKELMTMSTEHVRTSMVGPLAAARIFCRRTDDARPFYSDQLGLIELAIRPDWLVYDVGSAQLIVEAVPEGESEDDVGRFTAISFAVDDVARTCEALEARGVPIVGRPEVQEWGGTLAHVADPDGNVLTLVQYP
jgi:DNA-binding transcriptional MerR regulator